jgi:hypothetical protein
MKQFLRVRDSLRGEVVVDHASVGGGQIQIWNNNNLFEFSIQGLPDSANLS